MAAPPPSPLFPALFHSSRTTGWSYAEMPKCVPVELVVARPLVAFPHTPALCLSGRQHLTTNFIFDAQIWPPSEAKGAMNSRPGQQRTQE